MKNYMFVIYYLSVLDSVNIYANHSDYNICDNIYVIKFLDVN